MTECVERQRGLWPNAAHTHRPKCGQRPCHPRLAKYVISLLQPEPSQTSAVLCPSNRGPAIKRHSSVSSSRTRESPASNQRARRARETRIPILLTQGLGRAGTTPRHSPQRGRNGRRCQTPPYHATCPKQPPNLPWHPPNLPLHACMSACQACRGAAVAQRPALSLAARAASLTHLLSVADILAERLLFDRLVVAEHLCARRLHRGAHLLRILLSAHYHHAIVL